MRVLFAMSLTLSAWISDFRCQISDSQQAIRTVRSGSPRSDIGNLTSGTQDSGVRIGIEAKRLNPAERMFVRFTIENAGDSAVEIDEPSDWLAGLEITDPGGKLLKAPGTSESKRKIRLDARAFAGRSVDISLALAGKSYDEGVFRLAWNHAGARSAAIDVLVIRDYWVKVATNLGDFTIELQPDTAPKNVLHFVELVRKGFYDGKIFHRVIPRFMMQGGNAKPDGTGDYGTKVAAEFNARKHVFGTVSMARRADPDSAMTDFFVCLTDCPFLDGKYTVIGRVAEGDSVLREIENVKTDHSPCAGCGQKVAPEPTDAHCGQHHSDKPEIDVVMKKVTLTERKK